MSQPMTRPRDPFILTDGEKLSPVWIKLMAYCEDRLQNLRIQNDGIKNENDTAMLRGRIAELKTLISFNNVQPGLENFQD